MQIWCIKNSNYTIISGVNIVNNKILYKCILLYKLMFMSCHTSFVQTFRQMRCFLVNLICNNSKVQTTFSIFCLSCLKTHYQRLGKVIKFTLFHQPSLIEEHNSIPHVCIWNLNGCCKPSGFKKTLKGSKPIQLLLTNSVYILPCRDLSNCSNADLIQT